MDRVAELLNSARLNKGSNEFLAFVDELLAKVEKGRLFAPGYWNRLRN